MSHPFWPTRYYYIHTYNDTTIDVWMGYDSSTTVSVVYTVLYMMSRWLQTQLFPFFKAQQTMYVKTIDVRFFADSRIKKCSCGIAFFERKELSNLWKIYIIVERKKRCFF